MLIERTALPGVGTSYVATTTQDRRIGVIGHRSGRRDLVVYDADDPDVAALTLSLDPAEARWLAALLLDAVVIERD
jgi:TrkA domain protein